MTNCPVCNTILVTEPSGDQNLNYLYNCKRCGEFVLHKLHSFALEGLCLDNPKRVLLSHYVRKSQKKMDENGYGNSVKLTTDSIKKILETEKLPDVAEQINLVIDYIGKKSESLGHQHYFDNNTLLALQAYAGCMNMKSLSVILSELKENSLVNFEENPGGNSYEECELTFKGWQKYEEIKKGKTESKKAFMAMKFDKSLDEMYSKFQKAVEQTGFQLNRLDEFAEPGLIDVRMYQRIKTCKFVIADLTHGNQGAYWEAGYAAGLGKKVIYTCQKSVFDADKTKENKVIHFDVNHHQMVLWDEKNLQDAIEKLKAMIRVTFPEDSTQEDKNDKAA